MAPSHTSTRSRARIEIEGIVQGVGFRPFVFRLAARHGLAGWVNNTAGGVTLEVEGAPEALERFVQAIPAEAPPLAAISSVRSRPVPATGEASFRILASAGGENRLEVAPDGDVCGACLAELFDPSDRRHRHPFITCTSCGPRLSIITGVPYDRARTSMAQFPMCDACRAEYEDPADRRFHAQPVACRACGPRVRLLGPDGRSLAEGDGAVDAAIALLGAGRVLAVKGVGGYHLAADPFDDGVVATLRARKHRDEKPFAVMAPDLAAVRALACCGPLEERLLEAVERPIVLLPRREGAGLSPRVAPSSGYLGVMLPSTPLQHLVLRGGGFRALVMTSANRSDEPIVHREHEALAGLAGIADAFLAHDREIVARCDDSVIRVFQGGPLFLRRSRGYVPRAVTLPAAQESVLAVGAELKNAFCLTRGDRAFPGPHVGDLKNEATRRSFSEAVAHLAALLDVAPAVVAHDLHPDYLSTHFAEDYPGARRVGVQHHHAHLASCMAEHRLEGDVIGVVFDGAGLGPDGTTWGGEFLLGSYDGYERRGRFREVRLPGGDAAAREPYRMAASYLFDLRGEAGLALQLPCLERLAPALRPALATMLARGVSSPPTTSCGRLFDAIAALVGARFVCSYEGQAAIELEAMAERAGPCGAYPWARGEEDGVLVLDWRPTVEAVLAELARGVSADVIARRFHETVAEATADVCAELRRRTAVERVVLSGGVFQNKLLTEALHGRLTARGFGVFTHRLVPPNDGGLALGQAVVAGRAVARAVR